MACCFCNRPIDVDIAVAMTEKGCKTINEISDCLESSNIHVTSGQRVHVKCRLHYTRRPAANKSVDENKNPTVAARRSGRPTFNFKEHCLFCGQPAKEDDWGKIVLGRIEFARDLHAVDAVYHNSCNVNFRTGKQIPKGHDGEGEAKYQKRTLGRRTDTIKCAAFLKVARFLEDNDEEQLTISDLVSLMEMYLEDDNEVPYSKVHMKARLHQYFGNEKAIIPINNQNVVTFREITASIISDFYKKPKGDDSEVEKAKIIQTSARLIESEIKDLPTTTSDYPSSDEMSSVEKALEYLPDLLQLFLENVFVGKDVSLKIASVGQAIIQATRPRAVLAPLQVGLALQLHHHFASKFLIECLNAHGFCSPYETVQKYERNRSGTFHGMGIIAVITPSSIGKKLIPKRNVTSEEIAAAGRIVIHEYRKPTDNTKLIYQDLKDLKVKDATVNLNTLCKLTVPPFQSPRPGWSGTMQNALIDKPHPGKSSVLFFLMIDLNPSDMSCIYSTLKFVCYRAKRYGFAPVLTFDQPLYWKALTIIENEPEDSELRPIVLRLGALHLHMSFLGSIGHLMAGSGLKDVFELIYAKNAVTHMLTGKAISRAIRGHLLVNSALNAMLASKTYDITLPTKSNEVKDPASDPQQDAASPLDTVDAELQLETVVEASPESESDEQTPLTRQEVNGAPFQPSTQISNVGSSQTLDEIQEDDVTLAKNLLCQLDEGKCSVEEICSSQVVKRISTRLKAMHNSLKNQRTAVLRLSYMRMIDILQKSIKAERTGNWDLHLQSVLDMLPYFAASGHKLYEKSAYIYLQKMRELEAKHPSVYESFQEGFHVARRGNRHWAGLSTDLMIEQVLMRSVKTSGGLTRGKGLTETQRLVWLMSMPACAEVNDAMQSLTGVRLSFVATGGNYGDPKAFFEYEMCSFPPSLFDSSLLLRKAKKPVLADAIWVRTKDHQTSQPPARPIHCVLDGGSLLHRIPWPRNETYDNIIASYVRYVDQRYNQATVVFDGYESGPSTKDSTHQRRSSTKQKSGTMRVWNIKNTVEALGPDICKNILFAHAILGCDTTSALYGLSLKMLTSDATSRQQADIFHQADAAKNDIAAAGETALLCLYKGLKDETLDSLRYARFCQKISTGNTQVQPESLPPNICCSHLPQPSCVSPSTAVERYCTSTRRLKVEGSGRKAPTAKNRSICSASFFAGTD
ncbi:predicted protein [Nematostella vectensis]|uniref:Uncharacterized protein n=1 Tax=Nematostella vectensis TaxID=45351 RepID=A7SQT4_NEMVE|nr:predicted protein [Nematostella vectensis]|eukprot:XP_001626044.1 predicted protein [Nematostella vectensis]